jgi:hypothetical protein
MCILIVFELSLKLSHFRFNLYNKLNLLFKFFNNLVIVMAIVILLFIKGTKNSNFWHFLANFQLFSYSLTNCAIFIANLITFLTSSKFLSLIGLFSSISYLFSHGHKRKYLLPFSLYNTFLQLDLR